MAEIEALTKSKIKDERIRLMVNLMYTASWVNNYFNEFVKPYNISNQQYNILRILRGAGDWLNMAEVKSRMIEKSPNATRLTDKLISKELIERKRSDQDRRVVYVRITQKGLDLLDEISEIDDSSLLDRIDPKDAKELNRVLDAIRG